MAPPVAPAVVPNVAHNVAPNVAPQVAAAPSAPTVTVSTEHTETDVAAQPSGSSVSGAAAPAPTMDRSHDSAPHDPFDAFDSAWAAMEPPSYAGIEPSTVPAPLDETSLGSSLDAPEPWTQEITSAAEAIAQAGESEPDSPPAESRPLTPSLGIPAWLADDSQTALAENPSSETIPTPAPDPAPVPGTWSPIEADGSYSAADWSDLAALPPAEEIVASVTEPTASYPPDQSLGSESAQDWSDAAAARLAPVASRFEIVEEPPVAPATVDRRTLHGWRVSSALDRLAERVRSGEIDVSSVAPEANDAAVLASVLAALLGGSSSR
jgi:hypothetical protein